MQRLGVVDEGRDQRRQQHERLRIGERDEQRLPEQLPASLVGTAWLGSEIALPSRQSLMPR